MMKTGLTVLLVLLTLPLSAAQKGVVPEGQELTYGKRIFEQTCASCHGADGKANTNVQFIVRPRDLTQSILTEEESYNIISKGSHYWGSAADIMPSFESVYTDDELRAVAKYVGSFNPDVKERIAKLMAESDPIPPEKVAKMDKRGKKIYNRNCAWCHGFEGNGDGDATRNPEMSIFPYAFTRTMLTEDQIFLYAKYGGKFWGTDKEDMPAWGKAGGGKYDDFTLKSVAKYIKENLQTQK
jgi:mono/diheme cytochrome c family protein